MKELIIAIIKLLLLLLFLWLLSVIPGVDTQSGSMEIEQTTSSQSKSQQEAIPVRGQHGRSCPRRSPYLRVFTDKNFLKRDMTRNDQFEYLSGCFMVETRRHGDLMDSMRVCAGESPTYKGGTWISFTAIGDAELCINWQ